MKTKKLFVLIFWLSTVASFIVNFIIAMSMPGDYRHHEIWYYAGSFLTSSIIGAIIGVIAIMTLRRMHQISN